MRLAGRVQIELGLGTKPVDIEESVDAERPADTEELACVEEPVEIEELIDIEKLVVICHKHQYNYKKYITL